MDIRVDMDKYLGILALVHGHQGEARFWALVALQPSRYTEYTEKIANGDELVITDYGVVIDTGPGTMPSAEQLDAFAEKYGADYRFLNRVGVAHEQQRA